MNKVPVEKPDVFKDFRPEKKYIRVDNVTPGQKKIGFIQHCYFGMGPGKVNPFTVNVP
jgi:hypothetical protein